MSLTAAERETIVTLNDEDDVLHVWTAQRPWITRLKKNPAARLIEEGKHDGSVWARFELPADLLTFRSKRTRLELTDEQRETRRERLALARAARGK